MDTIFALRLAVVGLALAVEPGAPSTPDTGITRSKESVKGQAKVKSKRDHVKAILDSKIDLDFDEATLLDVLEAIRVKTGANIVLDAKALEGAGVHPREDPVTIDVTGISVRSALKLILREHDLTWLCREDEVIFITTTATSETIFEVRVFPVGDLLVPVTGESLGAPRLLKVKPDGSVASNTGADDLIEMITGTVWPTTWAEVGGAGTVKFLPNALALIISQTYETLEDIEALLAKLREIRKSQVTAAVQANPDELISESYAMPRHAPTWRDSPMIDANTARYEAELKISFVNAAETAKEFAHVIPQVIDPVSWKTAGGPGEIFVVSDRLVIRQTKAVHAQIARLLEESSPQQHAGTPVSGTGFSGS